MVGTEPKEWLKKIDDDQNLKALTELDDTRKDQQGRHYFLSQSIQPVVIMGGYSDDQGRITLHSSSWRDSMVPGVSFTTASQAAFTLTCAVGHRYRVYLAQARDLTTAALMTLSGTLSGSALTGMVNPGTAPTNAAMVAIGSSGSQWDAAGATVTGIKEVWMSAGDTLTMTLTHFVVAPADDTEFVFLYEDYTL